MKELFTHDDPVRAKLLSMGYKAWDEPSKIATWREEGGFLTVPRGGSAKALGACRGKWTVEDRRSLGRPDLAGKIPPYSGFDLRDYQREMVDLVEREETVLVRASTGCGKTSAGFASAARINLPTIVVVWGSALLKQWVDRAQKELGIAEQDVGIVRGKERKIRPLTIAMQQTLRSRLDDRELFESFGFLIVDEIQQCPARTHQEVIDAFPAKYRLGISDDERRADGKEFLTYDQFGEVRKEVEFEKLADAGVVLDVEVRCVPTRVHPPPGYWNDPKFNDLLDHLTVDAGRNEAIVELIEDAVRAGEQVLVFSHRVNHCTLLDRMLVDRGLRSGLLLGGEGWEPTFARTRAGLEDGGVRVGIGTIKAIGAGIDLPSMGVGIAATPIGSKDGKAQFRQIRGRLCRSMKGKDSATLYALVDPHVQGASHVRNFAAWTRRVAVRNDAGDWQEAAEWLKENRGRWTR